MPSSELWDRSALFDISLPSQLVAAPPASHSGEPGTRWQGAKQKTIRYPGTDLAVEIVLNRTKREAEARLSAGAAPLGSAGGLALSRWSEGHPLTGRLPTASLTTHAGVIAAEGPIHAELGARFDLRLSGRFTISRSTKRSPRRHGARRFSNSRRKLRPRQRWSSTETLTRDTGG
jgi:hypothetical protein